MSSRAARWGWGLAGLLLIVGLLGSIWLLGRNTTPTNQKESPTLRDWSKHPAIVQIDTPHDIYALGDIHGDFERLITLLTSCRIIAGDPGKPEKVQWLAGQSILVCTGDLIDKGTQSLQGIALLRALQARASEAGGAVVVTMGNHEAEFLAHAGQGRKAFEFVRELRATGVSVAEVAAGQDALGIGRFLLELPFAVRVNDWFFAHAGNTHGLTLEQLEQELRAGVDRHGFRSNALLSEDSLLEARLHPTPWWERPGDDLEQGKSRLRAYAEALGVKHFVLGHQPGKVVFADGSKRKAGRMHQALDGLVFLIDVGMSRAVGLSNGALLHVRCAPVRAVALSPHEPPKTLWP